MSQRRKTKTPRKTQKNTHWKPKEYNITKCQLKGGQFLQRRLAPLAPVSYATGNSVSTKLHDDNLKLLIGSGKSARQFCHRNGPVNDIADLSESGVHGEDAQQVWLPSWNAVHKAETASRHHLTWKPRWIVVGAEDLMSTKPTDNAGAKCNCTWQKFADL